MKFNFKKTGSFILHALWILTFFILLISALFSRYYVVADPDESYRIEPISDLSVETDYFTAFLDRLQSLNSSLTIRMEEFTKPSLFD